MIRWADDFIIGFELESDAQRVMSVLPKRFARYGLELHPEKTSLIQFGKPPSKNVNPDEIVALGAATQSGIMGGELQEVILLDVTPRSLGVRVAGDKMSVIIPAQTTIPTREQKVFATTEANQNFVAIEVYQGESEVVGENRRLGRFILGDLPAAPAGHVRVSVSFTMDVDGLLEVSAIELGSGKATTVTIEAASGLSRSELLRLSEARH